MTRLISLNARTSLDAAADDDFQIALIQFEHADLAEPIRMSTDPTERLSTDPLIYGTRSTWRGADPASEWFRFIVASLELPDDEEDVPAETRIVIDLFDASLPMLLRSFSTRATAHFGIAMASTPSVIEAQFLNLDCIASEFGRTVTLRSSRRPIEEEAAPMDIIGKDRFPGLFR